MIKSSDFRPTLLGIAALGVCLLCSGCGMTSSSGSTTTTQINTPTQGQVTLFLQDAPVDGVVSCNVTLTDAGLFDSGGTRYPLLAWSRSFELRQLRLASALAVASVSTKPATFSSVEIGLSTPRLSVVGPNGMVQQLTATTSPSVTLTNSTVTVPVSFTLAAGQSQGVMLDFDLKNSLSVDGNGNYLITPVLKSAVTSSTGPSELSMTLVKVSAIQAATKSMDVQVLSVGDTVHVTVDSNTAFDPSVGQFSSLTAGQMIELEAKFQTDGTYLAKYVNPGAPDPTLRFQGVLMDTHQTGTNPVAEMVVR
jgi:Domain of unknown function (DUF4382)/Domain of unknown function (DUF5666)